MSKPKNKESIVLLNISLIQCFWQEIKKKVSDKQIYSQKLENLIMELNKKNLMINLINISLYIRLEHQVITKIEHQLDEMEIYDWKIQIVYERVRKIGDGES
ncbi:unnamed protein product [Paramecium octaurelia]|uniref:Uncharacterized protein n=1 Tax=Paramecium octaurelia TaxID=43137 RepID=A0A8S1RYZ2_PAROT|nr:unnamed protein product [Paramecium octaurelia]